MVLSQRLSGVSEENSENPQAGWSMTQPRYKLGISQLKVYSVTISEQLGTCSLPLL